MAVRWRQVATGSQPEAVQAAMAAMPKGNAVDAVVAGVLAAAAVSPSVLFGPVQVLVGGTTQGRFAVDGRGRQPGLGAPRPRGFLSEDTIPLAARVAVPALPGALAAAIVSWGLGTWNRAMGTAIELASGDPARKAFLRRLGQAGPSLLADPRIADEFVHQAGRMAGGLLTVHDLESVRPLVEPCAISPLRGRTSGAKAEGGVAGSTSGAGLGRSTVLSVPWGAEALRDPSVASEDGSAVRVIAARDSNGGMAIAAYEVRSGGLPLPELGLEAPPTAIPVLRGKTRVKPGLALTAAAPIALVDTGGIVDIALGIAEARNGEEKLVALLQRHAEGALLSEVLALGNASEGPVEGGGVAPTSGRAYGLWGEGMERASMAGGADSTSTG